MVVEWRIRFTPGVFQEAIAARIGTLRDGLGTIAAAMKKEPRIDVNSEPEALTTRPLEGLAGLVPSGAAAPAPEEASADPPAAEAADAAYTVAHTRKGGFHVALERRPNGKTVTVLHGVAGDAEALLRALKKTCGAGGAVRGDAVEIQGDHRAAVVRFLERPDTPGKAR